MKVRKLSCLTTAFISAGFWRNQVTGNYLCRITAGSPEPPYSNANPPFPPSHHGCQASGLSLSKCKPRNHPRSWPTIPATPPFHLIKTMEWLLWTVEIILPFLTDLEANFKFQTLKQTLNFIHLTSWPLGPRFLF